MLLLFASIFLLLVYSVLIITFNEKWKRISTVNYPSSFAGIRISVLIPARNEQKNIGALLDALLSQNYPKEFLEIIVINDNSTDDTVSIVNRYKEVKLLHLDQEVHNSYKKKAIELGVSAATGDFIVTTDADCIPKTEWLANIAGRIRETDAVFVAAPVVINDNGSTVQRFQSMDFMVLQGITAVGVSSKLLSMCNGANMAYSKAVFEEVRGYEGIDRLASGDDMLLLHKIKTKYPDRITYLKSTEANVTTAPVDSWKDFFQQRIRWASKATFYDDKKITVVLVIVYLFNLMFLVWLIMGFINHTNWFFFLGLLFAKTIVEIPFFLSLAKFYRKKNLLVSFILFQPLHILYTIASGFLGQFGKYEWKGRKVK